MNEDIRVRKLRGDKYDASYCLPKTQVIPRPPRSVTPLSVLMEEPRLILCVVSPLRKELARAW